MLQVGPVALEIFMPCFEGFVIVVAKSVPVFHNVQSFAGCSDLLCRGKHGVREDVFVGPFVGIRRGTFAADRMQEKQSVVFQAF